MSVETQTQSCYLYCLTLQNLLWQNLGWNQYQPDYSIPALSDCFSIHQYFCIFHDNCVPSLAAFSSQPPLAALFLDRWIQYVLNVFLMSTCLHLCSKWIFSFIVIIYLFVRASQVALVVKDPSASAGNARDAGLIPGLGRSPVVRNGNPLQYSHQG